VAHCDDCRHRRAEDDTPDVKVLELVNRLSPGDCLVMEAAIASLHAAHPGRFLTAVRTPVNSLFENHPHVHQISPLERSRPGLMMTIDMQYPAISQSDSRGIHFMQAYCEFLEQQIGVPVPLLVNAPRVYLSAQEKGWMSQVQELTGDGSPYVVVNAGRKADFTAKWAGTAFYQRVVDLLRPRVRCVQVGDQSHHHPPLAGVIDLRGKTDTRQLVRLTYHAAAGIGPSTFLQHLFAAHRKLYVCVAGGREPVQWLQYPMQTTLHSIGRYPCCRDRSCWRSRTVKLGDGAEQDGSVCSLPVVDAGGDAVPKCLADIRPEAAAEAILAVIGRV
jgi:ADP-heptose:LPS heptosyltransferase